MANTDLPNPHDYVLVLSVGGNSEPLIKSIQHYHPLNVIFIASRESNANILHILKQTEGIGKYATIIISDHQDLLACVRDIRQQIPVALDTLQLPADILLIADITGGTKVMSSALTLAMMEFNSRFTYVGGSNRPKTNERGEPVNTGQVLSGTEEIMPMDNPWDVIGVQEAARLAQAFNSGQFEAAREKANFIKSKNGDYDNFYGALGAAIEAFQNWDSFNHDNAYKQLKHALGRLSSYNNHRHENFQPLYAQLQQAFNMLTRANEDASILREKFERLEQGCGEAYLRDLVGNARRRARRGHYDDAVARLYSAIEKAAKIALAQKEINNSAVSREILAQASPEIAAKYASSPNDEVKLPLTDSLQLICALHPDHRISRAYMQYANDLAKTLENRNKSLLAHGYRPVKAEDYQKLFDVTLKFLGIQEEELPDFPVLEINSILF